MQISPKTLASLENWYHNYISGFSHENSDKPNGYAIKSKHTQAVCSEMLALGKSLRLNANQLRIAHIIALFHDIGRWEQFRKYGSFLDAKTENHALLGVKILKSNKVLSVLPEETATLILKAIQLHNAKSIPAIRNKELLFFVKMIRDTDKLDILNLTSHHYQNLKNNNSAIELSLPNLPEYSSTICEQLKNNCIVDFKLMSTLNDFKLVQLGWVFDIHFNFSLLKILNGKYIELIASTLPKEKPIQDVVEHIETYVAERLNLQKEFSS